MLSVASTGGTICRMRSHWTILRLLFAAAIIVRHSFRLLVLLRCNRGVVDQNEFVVAFVFLGLFFS